MLALILVLASVVVLSAIITATGTLAYLAVQFVKRCATSFNTLHLSPLNTWVQLPARAYIYVSENAPALKNAAASQLYSVPHHLSMIWGWTRLAVDFVKQVPWRKFSAPVFAAISKGMTIAHFTMMILQIILTIVGLGLAALRVVFVVLRFTFALLSKSASTIRVRLQHWLARLENQPSTKSQSPIELDVPLTGEIGDAQGASTAVSAGKGKAIERNAFRSDVTEADPLSLGSIQG